ncbi:tRNA (N(6)-L-threonylcarbamoyladenosine(37)-C(2))-methylthiotransferase MtaB [Halanaerobacter jeridensis]|uniref:Threonylcarbamoyladenosine tRNA methylthiotransferase MtaB n=1 Tax=Halanaerobacter jeridensis TaxID=706427 RepID=A0A939BRP6_9FIRM|nr:tRNA (N(6)-L-threonylcarbamoyladenosine(37)-C(2))-methylthiotransferase MtaB [Halanaerobacter jeridensis]MBM7556236.1 threonylcarbamoyladenosine tRNA methylthiotransferase MtaB [Halanaerobacter jeridensis]
MSKVAFYTLGCKANQYDTQMMRAQFEKENYEIVDYDEIADIYIINTCTVTHQGARKSRKITRRLKRKNPEAYIAVVGCYAQVDSEEVLEIEGVDLILGTKGRERIVDFVEQGIKAGEKVNFVQDLEDEDPFENVKLDKVRGKTRANIKIQDGCEQFCAYCIIPYARGGLKSRPLDSTVTEVQKLVEHGVKEIVLTGIHLGEYGQDQENLDLVTLLRALIKIENLERIRLSSIEGTEVSEELIYLIAESDKLCRHLHLPLQSGSNQVLEAMNRPYTVEEFKDMVEQIRDRIPEIAITTDVIVGFPGESEADFSATCEVVKELAFSSVHVFKYSKREGTPAAKFDDQVHSRVKKQRSKKLREIAKKLAQQYREKFIGTRQQVLLEDRRDNQTGLLTGLTDNYLRVLVDASDELQGELVRVELTENNNNLYGQVIE